MITDEDRTRALGRRVMPSADAGILNGGSTYWDIVGGHDAGRAALDFYARRYRHTDEAGWRAAIISGRVLRDGVSLAPETRLAAGDRLAYRRPPWREPPAPRAFDVLHEDDAVLAVAKPAGLPVLPGGGFLESTLLRLVRAAAREGAGDAGRDAWSPVHRLGRGTSGIVLFGKSSAACRALSEELRSRRALKIYLGIADGLVQPGSFVARFPIGLVEHPPIGAVHASTPDGKTAETRFRVLARDATAGLSLVLARLVTGRPHQIRIHLAASGFPLEGDPFYARGGGILAANPATGHTPRIGDCGYRLHAWRARLSHPDGRSTLAIRAPIPPAFFAGTEWSEPGECSSEPSD